MATTDPWHSRARRTVSRLRGGRWVIGSAEAHYVVCGSDPLAYRLVNELLREPGTQVTVIAGSRRRSDVPDICDIEGVRVVISDRLDEETFRKARLNTALGLALMQQDDVGNIHAALRAQQVNPDLRLVIRIFNAQLGEGIKRLFADCAVMSDAAMAAPAFAAAALGEVEQDDIWLYGRVLRVARRADVRDVDVVCGLADTGDPSRLAILPENQDTADVVLAEAATPSPGAPPEATKRRGRVRGQRSRPLRGLTRVARAMVTRKIGLTGLAIAAVVVFAGIGLSRYESVDFVDGLYLTVLTTISGAEPEKGQPLRVEILQVLLTVAGLALIPLITAAVVEAIVRARLAVAMGRDRAPRSNHVVVVGLGNVGTRVIRQLYDLGVEVVAIDKSETARGAAVARELGIPFLVGDAASEQVLRDAYVQDCQALVIASTDDVTNLQTALHGRALQRDLRVVMRLFDGDFAEKIEKAFNIATSRSVSYLAAPAFAGALIKREVLATIPLDRHVLLVAEVTVAAGSPLEGGPAVAVNQPNWVRLIALARFGEPRPIWVPAPGYKIAAGDRLTVVARRAGLTRLLDQASPPPEPEEPTTTVPA
ncbi:NAD-binding protein [Rhizomonospora bruguierae]|uniref:NAD-binding protein n=1 Tax=Rhizomonospora bruguierae TaxID=1581705 RepID=UPI001BD0E21E|nr:NAD-binding protein [Micromonospora sp. NBRC 107566]